MISFLEGKIEYCGNKYVILSAGGIGYKVAISPKLLDILSKSIHPVKDVNFIKSPLAATGLIRLFIHSQLNMRDGTFDMYGFQDKEDLELFHLVTSVNGIGPKSAMGILSTIEPKYLKAAIMNDDVDYLKKVSGLGPKTAQRLILELKNKIDYLDVGDIDGINLGQEGQAMEALLALGYSSSQAKDALKDAKGETLEKRVREALRFLGKK